MLLANPPDVSNTIFNTNDNQKYSIDALQLGHLINRGSLSGMNIAGKNPGASGLDSTNIIESIFFGRNVKHLGNLAFENPIATSTQSFTNVKNIILNKINTYAGNPYSYSFSFNNLTKVKSRRNNIS
mgnify:CR=1 FL=1|uniref:Uncharacterized protein n=1 Tax=viral metagenome TaxID=1070528 RepID=A0A6C0AY21_9ZZZZ|tara:strand:+ start:992 stop:1372 length:381 start_codon:yes stop_codon:yes gene_type:complete